jgi:predicted nucleic acid-binding Zn ribbon protein
MEETKECLECGQAISGRIDKKFCSDQCRTSYNNRLNSDSTRYMKSVNRILRKNRKILSVLNPHGKSKTHKKKLISLGFNFRFHTNVYRTRSGKTYYFCYDHGYLPIDNDYFALVIREEYVD